MDSTTTTIMVFLCIAGAVLLGMALRRVLPEEHLKADSRDAVKLAMGLVATMAALLLGLLISSAKDSFDAARNDVAQLAAKVAFLDRALQVYGPETAAARTRLHAVMNESVAQLWPDRDGAPVNMAPDAQAGNPFYKVIQQLVPRDETQSSLTGQIVATTIEIGQLRELLAAHATPSISQPLLVIVVSWLVVIFLGFSVVSPTNLTTGLALLVTALSVTGAVFLILELDQPFVGLLRVSGEPFFKIIAGMAN